jgi:hypothetical protein
MKILFLDDDQKRCRRFRAAHPTARIVHTAQEAIAALGTEVWEVVSLDHDLGGQQFQNPQESTSGSAVARFLAAHELPIGRIIIHSFNVPAAQAMRALLDHAGYRVTCQPFALG